MASNLIDEWVCIHQRYHTTVLISTSFGAKILVSLVEHDDEIGHLVPDFDLGTEDMRIIQVLQQLAR